MSKMARSRCVVDRITLHSIKQLQRRALNPGAPSDTRVLLHAPPGGTLIYEIFRASAPAFTAANILNGIGWGFGREDLISSQSLT